jgi:protein-S-isoprenylcysteine O-methyltransferase Ste14
MSVVIDVLVIIALFSLFAVSHTLLASSIIKIRIRDKLKDRIAFYRMFYNVTSLIIFFIIYSLSPKPDILIYDLQSPYDIIIFLLQVAALVGFFIAGSQTNFKEFLGVSQITRYINHEYDVNDLDEKQNFTSKGLYKYTRHPIYFFSILFLVFRPSMDLFYVIFLVCMIGYFFAGSYYEEKKLVLNFGDEYLDYQKRVPRIFPRLF